MTTIPRALSDYHSTGTDTKQRVLKLAKKLNYQPTHLAAALRRGQSLKTMSSFFIKPAPECYTCRPGFRQKGAQRHLFPPP